MWRKIAIGTVIVGALDITEVMLFYAFYRGVAPTRVLQGVAAGLVGRGKAFEGGIATAMLGLAIHFCIALVVVTLYHLAAKQNALGPHTLSCHPEPPEPRQRRRTVEGSPHRARVRCCGRGSLDFARDDTSVGGLNASCLGACACSRSGRWSWARCTGWWSGRRWRSSCYC